MPSDGAILSSEEGPTWIISPFGNTPSCQVYKTSDVNCVVVTRILSPIHTERAATEISGAVKSWMMRSTVPLVTHPFWPLIVRLYLPAAFRVLLAIIGFSSVELNPSGPVH